MAPISLLPTRSFMAPEMYSMHDHEDKACANAWYKDPVTAVAVPREQAGAQQTHVAEDEIGDQPPQVGLAEGDDGRVDGTDQR
jgi:hypothetical protein